MYKRQEEIEAGKEPSVLLNEMLLPAIDEVGKLFDQGKYFLPQLIASAEAMKPVSYTHLDVYKRQGRTLHPDNMAAGPASYGFTDTLGRMHSDAQFAGSSSVPAHVCLLYTSYD